MSPSPNWVHTIDLCDLTTTANTDADGDLGVLVKASDHDGLKSLDAESLVGDGLDGVTIETDGTVTAGAVSDGKSGLLDTPNSDFVTMGGQVLCTMCVEITSIYTVDIKLVRKPQFGWDEEGE